MKILRLRAVVQKIGIARSTIYDWINPKSPRYDPTFPRQVQLGQKSVGWLAGVRVGTVDSTQEIKSSARREYLREF
ncbi:AlpA family phage regulatory protein [Serratia sp. MMO-24]